MPAKPLIESLESRNLFAASADINAAIFYDACIAADTDGSLTLSAAEATAYAGTLKAQAKAPTDAYKAAVKQATDASNETLRSLAAQKKADLAAASKTDRKSITANYASAVKTEKANLKSQLATLKTNLAESLATTKSSQAAFASLGQSLGKPFAADRDNDTQLDLHEGTQEFGALLARDDNGSSLSPQDLANLNQP